MTLAWSEICSFSLTLLTAQPACTHFCFSPIIKILQFAPLWYQLWSPGTPSVPHAPPLKWFLRRKFPPPSWCEAAPPTYCSPRCCSRSQPPLLCKHETNIKGEVQVNSQSWEDAEMHLNSTFAKTVIKDSINYAFSRQPLSWFVRATTFDAGSVFFRRGIPAHMYCSLLRRKSLSNITKPMN